jgi:hypothetical protein
MKRQSSRYLTLVLQDSYLENLHLLLVELQGMLHLRLCWENHMEKK